MSRYFVHLADLAATADNALLGQVLYSRNTCSINCFRSQNTDTTYRNHDR